ncbi:hypothetical protein JAAARDRAFT_244101 [Jaapia argillacea MUCL 33604]|uniref:Secreted protein n=1 Tax=Jaapia argillacea MUCL 33604 TaxID=933084 RepID=A0A067QDF2_9AGAM|nr:hypothetical protein JAAARDRAFT_244101 [Jaapia argillacea MUCL 33604]
MTFVVTILMLSTVYLFSRETSLLVSFSPFQPLKLGYPIWMETRRTSDENDSFSQSESSMLSAVTARLACWTTFFSFLKSTIITPYKLLVVRPWEKVISSWIIDVVRGRFGNRER